MADMLFVPQLTGAQRLLVHMFNAVSGENEGFDAAKFAALRENYREGPEVDTLIKPDAYFDGAKDMLLLLSAVVDDWCKKMQKSPADHIMVFEL